MLNDKQFLLACLMHDFGKFVKFSYNDNDDVKNYLGVNYRNLNWERLKDSHWRILDAFVKNNLDKDEFKKVAFLWAYHHIPVVRKILNILENNDIQFFWEDLKKLLIYTFILTIADNYSATQRTEDLFNENYDWLNNIFEKVWEWSLDWYKCCLLYTSPSPRD